ncbi:forespore capture DNA-binding protein RefZ [Alkalibacillus aidingensis]|uniref:forespore capture DNA-binding protein RefZ n=1 Tax=Alkalibacillus aidingensis TaxID=2747607 RepID=UPI001660C855|nr:forespore capture DNA-binding protein RefZ [Alkalibacillus aidingensis]
MTDQTTKEKIMQAAGELFYYNGFKGTSIRAITDKADVNVSLISYYFKNKQGLLEHMTVDYFEGYIALLESLMEGHPSKGSPDHFFQVIEEIIHYKKRHFQFTCFIQRELSLDNIFIRELFSTYVAKETFLLNSLADQVTEKYKLNRVQKEAFYIQLKSLINAPFTYANDWKKEYQWDDSQELFVKSYIEVLKLWFIE